MWLDAPHVQRLEAQRLSRTLEPFGALHVFCEAQKTAREARALPHSISVFGIKESASLRMERIPGVPRLRLDVGKALTRWRIGDAHGVVTSRTLNLLAGELGLTLEGLVAVRAMKPQFIRFQCL